MGGLRKRETIGGGSSSDFESRALKVRGNFFRWGWAGIGGLCCVLVEFGKNLGRKIERDGGSLECNLEWELLQARLLSFSFLFVLLLGWMYQLFVLILVFWCLPFQVNKRT